MPDLILIPTELERKSLAPMLKREGWSIELCGFGLIAAGVRTAQLIERIRPQRVLLVGIAGSFRSRCEVGSAYRFQRIVCDGIGVGTGDTYRTASDLGWNQFANIGDIIETQPWSASDLDSKRSLLSVCSASSSLSEAETRAKRHHQIDAEGIDAEDMEAFAVAMACKLASLPLEIVRGISNRAGDRDHAHWKIDEALQSAARLATRMMSAMDDA